MSARSQAARAVLEAMLEATKGQTAEVVGSTAMTLAVEAALRDGVSEEGFVRIARGSYRDGAEILKHGGKS